MGERQTRTSRTEWRKRIARWRDSGLSADEFAAEIGVNAGTLRQWKYTLNREERGRADRKMSVDAASFVEVQNTEGALGATASMFQLELGRERRLHIGSDFDATALERLLSLLERS
jgi:transposase-like protein